MKSITLLFLAVFLLPLTLMAATKDIDAAVNEMMSYDHDGDKMLSKEELGEYVRDLKSPFKEMKESNGKVWESDVKVQAQLQADALSEAFGNGDRKISKKQARKMAGEIEADEEPEFLKQIQKNVSIRQSFLNKDALAEPAKFSWSYSEEDSFYTVDGAIAFNESFGQIGILTDEAKPQLYGTLIPSFEAHVSSSDKATQNSLSSRLAWDMVLTPASDDLKNSWWTSQELIVSPVYDMNKELTTQTMGGDIFYTISIPQIALGQKKSLGSTPLYYSWRPYIGFEGGSVIVNESEPQVPENEYLRFIAKIHGELWITDRFPIVVNYTPRINLINTDDTFGLLEVSPILYLDAKQLVSVGITYKVGESKPQFEHVESLSAWVGLKF